MKEPSFGWVLFLRFTTGHPRELFKAKSRPTRIKQNRQYKKEAATAKKLRQSLSDGRLKVKAKMA
jgi:hypothetical protein